MAVLMVQSLLLKGGGEGGGGGGGGRELACDVFDTLTAHSGLLYDVTDADCWRQNGSSHGCVFVTFDF